VQPRGVADETFIVAAPSDVAMVVADERSWRRWWPDLELRVTRPRGDHGAEWAVRGAVVGRMEIWLEPFADGVILHYLLWVDDPGPDTAATLRRRVRDWKQHVHRLKDQLEEGREPGCPRRTAAKPADRASAGPVKNSATAAEGP